MIRLPTTIRRTFKSLRVRNYRLYFFGQIVSMSGTWMQTVAQAWLVLKLTGSGVALGITTGLQFTPILIAGVWGGVVADRFDKRRIVVITQAASAVLALVLGVLTATGEIELWMIYMLALLLGCVSVIDMPTRQSFVMEMVGPDYISNAVALNTAVFTSARVIGPAIAAFMISTAGIAPAFFVNALSFLAVIAAFLCMNPLELHRAAPAARGKGQLRAGLSYAWSQPDLRAALMLMAVVGTLAFNFRVLLPLMAQSVFNGGAGIYGTLSAVMGAGTVAGALISAHRARSSVRLVVASGIAFGALIVAAGLAPSLPLELAILVPLGAVSIIFVASCNTILQLGSSDEMRGRVMALYSVLFLGTTPIGSPLVGWIAETMGVRAAFVLSGAATLVGSVAAVIGLRRGAVNGPAGKETAAPPEPVAEAATR